jgi:hypothetical protein
MVWKKGCCPADKRVPPGEGIGRCCAPVAATLAWTTADSMSGFRYDFDRDLGFDILVNPDRNHVRANLLDRIGQ